RGKSGLVCISRIGFGLYFCFWRTLGQALWEIGFGLKFGDSPAPLAWEIRFGWHSLRRNGLFDFRGYLDIVSPLQTLTHHRRGTSSRLYKTAEACSTG